MVTIMLPDLTVTEVDTFLSNIYAGSTADASTNMDIFSLFGVNMSPISKYQNLLNDIGTSCKRSLSTKPSLPSAPKNDSILKTLKPAETKDNVEQEDRDRDSDSTLSADPLDTDYLKNEFDDSEFEEVETEGPVADSDHNKAKALELVEIKIKVENQEELSTIPSVREEEPSISSVREEEPTNNPDSGEIKKPKKKRPKKYKNPQNDNERIASDPIWEHVSNKDCTENSYSRGSVTCNYCEKTFSFGYVGHHIWAVHKIMVNRPQRYREGRPQDAKTAAHWAHFSEDPENKFRCICQLCGKNLSRISAAKHLRQKHNVGEKFLCSFCGKAFRDNNTKNSHELIHTKSYQYFCSLCGKGFYHNHQLNYHMLKVRDDSTEKPFQCSECGKSYKLNKDLSVHIHQTHKKKTTKTGNPQKGYTPEEIAKKPHKCDICGKRFAKQEYFNVHMRIHSGETKIECEICNKNFTDTSYLKKHIETIHSDERPYTCNVCEKSFKYKKVLEKHMFVHTKETPWS